MHMVSNWTVDKFYGLLSRSHLSLFNEQSALCTFLFHGLFNDKTEIEQGIVDPQQGITVAHFREFIEYYLGHGYVFVSPADILRGLAPGRNYALITFDDGYYNNHLALPVMKEYNVPATFFISTNHILQNKCFWWDVVYRERIKKATQAQVLTKEYANLKQKRNHEIEHYLVNIFGASALQPVGDIDRPFTPSELGKFSMEPLVTIGNHTSNHAILTNYNRDEIKDEIVECQQHLFQITGKQPEMIAYPNGNFSEDIISVSKEAKLRLGVTVHAGKNYLPLTQGGDSLFKLDRFTLWGNQNIKRQCEFYRTDIHSRRISRKFNQWNKTLCNNAG